MSTIKYETRIRKAGQFSPTSSRIVSADTPREAATIRYKQLAPATQMSLKEIEVIPVDMKYVYNVIVEPKFTIKVQ